MDPTDRSSSLGTRLFRWFLGAIGVVTLLRILPGALQRGLKRWLIGLIGEILVVFLAGLVTENLLRRKPNNDS